MNLNPSVSTIFSADFAPTFRLTVNVSKSLKRTSSETIENSQISLPPPPRRLVPNRSPSTTGRPQSPSCPLTPRRSSSSSWRAPQPLPRPLRWPLMDPVEGSRGFSRFRDRLPPLQFFNRYQSAHRAEILEVKNWLRKYFLTSSEWLVFLVCNISHILAM